MTAHAPASWQDEVRHWRRQRDAVVLAHNYTLPEIQDVADHVGDSLALSRVAAAPTPARSSSAASTSWPRRRSCSAPTRPC